jgi:hypothetical protein
MTGSGKARLFVRPPAPSGGRRTLDSITCVLVHIVRRSGVFWRAGIFRRIAGILRVGVRVLATISTLEEGLVRSRNFDVLCDFTGIPMGVHDLHRHFIEAGRLGRKRRDTGESEN